MFLKHDELKRRMADAEVPGVSIAYLDSTGAICSKGVGAIGTLDDNHEAKVTSETIFSAASLSKPVFAYMVLKLVQEGALKLKDSTSVGLDTPLYSLLPINQFYKEVCQKEIGEELAKQSQGLTIRRILSHQTGLPNSLDTKFSFNPGEGYEYSGLALMYLQLLIEKETGKKLDILAKELVFDNLQMKHSSFKAPNGDINAANTLYTTAKDYAVFMSAWLNDNNEIMREAFRPQVSLTKDKWAADVGVDNKDLECLHWGLGFGLQSNAEGLPIRAFHTGDMNQWRAQAAMNLEDKTAVVYMANANKAPAFGHALTDVIVTLNVDIAPAQRWFYQKFGFARDASPGFKQVESENMSRIGQYLQSRKDSHQIDAAAETHRTGPR